MASQLTKNIINMYKQIRLVFLLIIFSLSIKAQNINDFYLEANTARKLAESGKIDSAITAYENAFKKIDYVNTTYLNKILKLVNLNKDENRSSKYKKQISIKKKGI
ncbi:MAG: hypothetical protein COB15_09765, partial [Flavobacteriales bacterium]